MSDQLEIKCDNNEQYRRCTGIQILGIEVPEHESNDNLIAVVKSCHEKINQIVYRPCNQVGNKCTDENSGKKIRSVIAQFKSWKSRKDFDDARPRNLINCKTKPGLIFLTFLLI